MSAKGGHLAVTTIREILVDRSVHSVTPGLSIRDAAKLMAKNNVGALVVIDGGDLAGIISERDIVFRGIASDLPVDHTPAAAIMTRDPVTLDIGETISDALAGKLGDAFRHLPVLEDGRVVGLLSYRDIPAEYVMMFERLREMSSAQADDET